MKGARQLASRNSRRWAKGKEKGKYGRGISAETRLHANNKYLGSPLLDQLCYHSFITQAHRKSPRIFITPDSAVYMKIPNNSISPLTVHWIHIEFTCLINSRFAGDDHSARVTHLACEPAPQKGKKKYSKTHAHIIRGPSTSQHQAQKRWRAVEKSKGPNKKISSTCLLVCDHETLPYSSVHYNPPSHCNVRGPGFKDKLQWAGSSQAMTNILIFLSFLFSRQFTNHDERYTRRWSCVYITNHQSDWSFVCSRDEKTSTEKRNWIASRKGAQYLAECYCQASCCQE